MPRFVLSARNCGKTIRGLWEAYLAHPDDRSRNALVEHYLPVVSYYAQQLDAKTPAVVDRRDLEQYGVFGLIDAIESYDPSRGASFTTFASRRIWGAMIDGMRNDDWMPRTLRSSTEKCRRVVGRFVAEHGRRPDDEELRQAMGLSEEQFAMRRRAVSDPQQYSLSCEVFDNGVDPAYLRDDTGQADPVRDASLRDVMRFVLSRLTGNERAVFYYYYHRQLNMPAIARLLGLCESRVSQIHKSVMARVRRFFAGQAPDFATNTSRSRRRKYLRTLPRKRARQHATVV